MDQLLPENFRPVTTALSGAGALNWALVEFANTNVLTDTLGLTGEILTGTFAALGAAGAIVLYNTAAQYME